MPIEFLYLCPIFFIIALVYSMAGFGGGSSYLAILAIFSFDQEIIRSTALLCNIAVVSTGSYLYFKHGHLKLKRALPILLLSVPMAYVGGSIQLQQHFFFIILGIVLLFAAISMLIPIKEMEHKSSKRHSNKPSIFLGGGIGFLSGMVGIGGGIFLAPVLHLAKWDNAKSIAATCSFFILINSIAGLIGQSTHDSFLIDWKLVVVLFISVLIGGQIGSRLSSKKLDTQSIRRVAAILILIVAVRILASNFI